MKVGIKRPSPALVIAFVALIVTLTGTAFAAIAPNSVSSRQLKPRAVTNAKIANDAVTGVKVRKRTLVGSDFNMGAIGTIPEVVSSKTAVNANTVGNHAAVCPGGTTLIRGTCYDNVPAGPVLGIKAATDACAQKGGFLPTPMEAQSIRQAIFLGDGIGSNSVYTDSYAANTVGIAYGMTVVNNNSADFKPNEDEKTKVVIAFYHYVCAYRLVR